MVRDWPLLSHDEFLVGGFSSQQIDLSFSEIAMITATGAMTTPKAMATATPTVQPKAMA